MYRILIADDEQLIRDGLKKIIDWDEHGIEIVGEASNGQEALEKIHELKPDLLITDIRMPVMDGLKLIKAVREQNINLKIIIISGYDDFRYVKESLKYGVENYIVKPINKEELSSTIVGTTEKIQSELHDKIKTRENEYVIRDNIMNRLVTGRIRQKELAEKLPVTGIEGMDGCFTAAIVKALKKEDNRGDNKDRSAVFDGNLMEFALANILKETIDGVMNSSIFTDLNGDTVIIFHPEEAPDMGLRMESLLEKCIRNINNCIKTDVFIAVGDTQQGLEAAHLSYRAAGELLRYFAIFPRNYILTGEKSELERRKRLNFAAIEQDRLKALILSDKREEITDYLDSICNSLVSASSISMEHMNAFTVEVLACFINTIKEAFSDIDAVLSDYEELFSSLLNHKLPGGLINAIKKTALELADRIRNYREKPKQLIDQIIEYIGCNYQRQDISLKTLSSQFNITTPYLGQLLKKKTGELFSDYLNGIRMEKARELLTRTNMKANEISEKVGYSDPNYFYRVFKKSAGVYPSEYRDQA